MRYCIKGGEIIDPAGGYLGIGDLLINSEKIEAVGRDLPVEDAKIIDATGKLVCPGFIDLHTHLREPGREDKETVASGTKAALKGGYTAVSCMANTQPVADNRVVIEFVLKKAAEAGFAKVYPIGAITKGLKGEELAEMGEMAEAGVVAFSDDGKTLMNPAVLRSACEYTKLFELPLLLHEEDPNLAGTGAMHEGYWSTVLGLPGIPSIAESVMIGRDIQIAGYTGSKLHFCHLSATESVALVRSAKERGLAVTAEVTPHHLCFTDEDLQGYDPNLRVSPPVRSEQDRQALIGGLQDGTIDAVATDHAPHTLEEKHREFPLALTGMIGLETSAAAVWTELVGKGLMTKVQFVEKMSVNPARIINRPGGRVQPGDLADVVIFDPNAEWTVRSDGFVSRSTNSPFIGRQLSGKVTDVWVEGVLKICNEKLSE
jgi:dihydroorotase